MIDSFNEDKNCSFEIVICDVPKRRVARRETRRDHSPPIEMISVFSTKPFLVKSRFALSER